MGKKPWVTVADEIQLGCAQSSNPGGGATRKGVCFITTAHGATQPTQNERVCFQEKKKPKARGQDK